MDIKDYRNLIDDTDRQIVELLCKRAEYAAEIGKLKGSSGEAVYSRGENRLRRVRGVHRRILR